MTTIAQGTTLLDIQPRQGRRQRLGSALSLVLDRLGDRIHTFAVRGQMGPDREAEIGRWTGARV